ncbi:MAG: glycosyltransferase [Geminicoccaceae bacterium]
MIGARPVPQTGRRFAILCPGFAADRIRRQPWHVADGLARGLLAAGHAVHLCTDLTGPPPASRYPVSTLELLVAGRPSRALRAFLAGHAWDRIFLVTGAAQLARLGPLDLGIPVSLVMASPRLRPTELLRLGPLALYRERALLALPLLNALLPGAVLRAAVRRSGADRIVYLSEAARTRFAALGLPLGQLLRPQIEPDTVLPPPPPGQPFRLGYFGPPLAARGADLALRAFEAARARGLDGRLQLLLRPDSGARSIERFLARVRRSPCRDAIDCRVGMLEPAELRSALASCHAFILPFRTPVSEVPLAVIEAGLSGRPTIVLPAPGVEEIARRLGGIVAATPARLPDAILAVAGGAHGRPPGRTGWTDWRTAVAPLAERSAGLAAFRLVALVGVDGGGKTFLLRALERRLAEAGVPHRHVWTRFRNYLSKPLLALARLTGHNRKERVGAVRIGYHEFAGRPWLAWPFLVLQVADLVLDCWWRYHRRHDRRLVLADRCVYDTLVDLAVDTGLDEVLFGPLGRWLVARLPRPHLALVLNRPVAAIRADRPDVLLDRNFARRRALYRRLAAEFRLPVLENDSSPGQVLDRLERLAAGA